MSVQQFYDRTVVTFRLSDDVGVDTETFDTSIAALRCVIQPLEDRFSEDLSGSYGKDSLLFCDNVDVKIGDKVKDGNDEYLVQGVESLDFQGTEHKEVIIRSIKQ